AVNRAARTAARIIVGDQKPLVLGSAAAQQLRVGSGRVSIEAAEGTHPVVEVSLSAAAPALLVASPTASLTIRGLHFVVERKAADPRAVPAVIDCAGNLRVEDCSFTVKGADHRVRAIFARGRQLSLANSFLSGFETSIDVVSYQNSEVRVEQSILIGTPENNASVPPAGGWAAVYKVDTTRSNNPRKLTFKRCTIVGSGLVRFDGPLDKAALQVDISDCVVAGHAVVLWPGVPFPGLMKWAGQKNQYGVTSDALAATLAPAASAPALPKTLEAWSKTPAISESGSQERIIRFAVQPNGAGTRPLDYKLVDAEGVEAGANPAEVASPSP
ncbi:MAG: hypothetical protein K2X91_06020, partial [Thermoleophilia bacterium]|nr:hypothetical protein [Thermoleophilia bacterium]